MTARLPMFPLGTVLFPGATMPLHVFEPRYRALMRDCLAGDHRFGVVLIERGSEVGGGDQRAMVGTRAVITKSIELPDGRWLLQVRGEAVIAVIEWLADDPYPAAMVGERDSARGISAPLPNAPSPEAAKDGDVSGPDAAVLDVAAGLETAAAVEAAAGRVRRVRAVLAEHGGGPPLAPEVPLDGGGDAEKAAWELCAAAPLSPYDAQRLLATEAVVARARLLIELMDDLELDLQRMGAGD